MDALRGRQIAGYILCAAALSDIITEPDLVLQKALAALLETGGPEQQPMSMIASSCHHWTSTLAAHLLKPEHFPILREMLIAEWASRPSKEKDGGRRGWTSKITPHSLMPDHFPLMKDGLIETIGWAQGCKRPREPASHETNDESAADSERDHESTWPPLKKVKTTDLNKKDAKKGLEKGTREPTSKFASASNSKQQSKPSKRARPSSEFDDTPIHLPGEEDGTVPVFDNCNQIRTKIRAHLRSHGESQAAFLRRLSSCLPSYDTPINSKSLTDFLAKKGPLEGNSMKVFYAAYVYFEKERIRKGGKVPKGREEVEMEWGPMGIDTSRPRNRMWVRAGARF